MSSVLLYAFYEIPWVFLFIVFMGLVELQLAYCIPCMRAVAKLAEAGIFVVVLRLWIDPSFVQLEPWAATLRGAFANHTG